MMMTKENTREEWGEHSRSNDNEKIHEAINESNNITMSGPDLLWISAIHKTDDKGRTFIKR